MTAILEGQDELKCLSCGGRTIQLPPNIIACIDCGFTIEGLDL